MATLVYTSTHGSDDPTRAAFPFILANGAVEAGHQAQIFLAAEAVYLMKDSIRNAMVPVGWPPLREIFAKAQEGGVTIHV
jgi:predicted peroxiredoxin